MITTSGESNITPTGSRDTAGAQIVTLSPENSIQDLLYRIVLELRATRAAMISLMANPLIDISDFPIEDYTEKSTQDKPS